MRVKFKYSLSTFPKKGVNYVCIPKCGTTTMLHYLLDQPPFGDVELHSERHVKYISPEEANANGLTTFATIRHPFDRVLSMYKDQNKRGIGGTNKMSLDAFVRMVYTNNDEKLNLHFRTMNYFLAPLKNVKLIRLEIMHCNEWLKDILNIEEFKKFNVSELDVELSDNQKKMITERYEKDFQYLRETDGNHDIHESSI